MRKDEAIKNQPNTSTLHTHMNKRSSITCCTHSIRNQKSVKLSAQSEWVYVRACECVYEYSRSLQAIDYIILVIFVANRKHMRMEKLKKQDSKYRQRSSVSEREREGEELLYFGEKKKKKHETNKIRASYLNRGAPQYIHMNCTCESHVYIMHEFN